MALQSSNNNLSYARGLENRNFLTPIGFRFVITRMRGVDFFCNQVTLPSLTTTPTQMYAGLNKIPQPGDELQYGDLVVRFLVDENMKNYYQVHDWMREIATPKSSKEFKYRRGTLVSDNPEPEDRTTIDNQWVSDCSLLILSSNYNTVSEIIFKDAFPINLTTLTFDATQAQVEYLTAEVTMRYSYFDYEVRPAAEATDATQQAFHLSENGERFHTNTTAKPETQFDLPTAGGPKLPG